MADLLKKLAPKKKYNLIDLLAEAGHDISGWSNTSGNVASNPKYCYEWCFSDPKAGVILNLWHERFNCENGIVYYSANMRSDIEVFKRQGVASWVKRGTSFDTALQHSIKEGLPIRVIIQSGEVGTLGTMEVAKAKKRELDPKPWHIESYNYETGDYKLVRGVKSAIQFVDQFSENVNGNETPSKTEKTTSVFDRDPKVREQALIRANGHCEYCGEKGFPTPNGLYLETHHIIRLADGGPDTSENVIAVCPNDHKRAHFSVDRDSLQLEFQNIITEKNTKLSKTAPIHKL